MTTLLAAFGFLGIAFGRMGAAPKHASVVSGGTPTDAALIVVLSI